MSQVDLFFVSFDIGMSFFLIQKDVAERGLHPNNLSRAVI